MEKKTITFSANEQKLIKTGGMDCYASNTVAYIEAHFDLGENWSGYDSIRAVWFTDFVSGISTVLDSLGTCIVPYEVLTRKGEVKVNLVGSIADGDVLTDRLTTCPVVALTIKCNAKTDGDNTQPITPSEYEQFVASVKTDADRAEAGAESAEASAQSASESATASANSATSSEQSATASAESAQNAQNSAISAENAKDDAEDARDEILGMRATATTLEADSDATASYSGGLLTLGIPRGDKGVKGDTGETGATPNISIGTVSTLEPTEDATASITGTAEEPVLNLGIPKGDTGDVSLEDLEALLPTDTASGSIVTITDGQAIVPAKSLKVALEPIQDLHGYDKPWVGGAGVNKFDEITELGAIGSSDGVPYVTNDSIRSKNYCPCVGGTTYFFKGAVAVYWYDANKAFISTDYTNNNTKTAPSNAEYFRLGFYTSYGTTYNHDTAVNYPSSVTTYSPYSNICPISGRTEVVTQRTGKNLLNLDRTLGTPNPSAGTNTTSPRVMDTEHYYVGLRHDNYYYPSNVAEYSVTSNEVVVRGANNAYGVGFPIEVKPNTQYRVSATVEGSGYLGISYYDAQWHYISFVNDTPAFTTPSNASYAVILLRSLSTSATATWKNVQVELGTTATAYEPYNGQTYTTALGRTVYGGTLDVVSGELVVDRAMVDLGTLNWTYYSAQARFRTTGLQGTIKNASSNSSASGVNAICSQYALTSYNGTASDNGAFGVSTDGAVCIKDTNYTDATAFKTAMNGVQFCYELATPQTIQLTPQEVRLLLGTNNVWSDGDVTLVYNADIQLWVEKQLS